MDYKTVYRRVLRLPLDAHSLALLRSHIRDCFRAARPGVPVVDARKVKIMDDILERGQYKQFDALLDVVYKDFAPVPAWIGAFSHTRYLALRQVWPQAHIIDDFGDKKSVDRYHKELLRREPPRLFLVMEQLGLDDAQFAPLVPIKHSGRIEQRTELQSMVDELVRFTEFLIKNNARLLDKKIQPLDVWYEPSRFGLPRSAHYLDLRLKYKVNYAKSLLRTFRPIEKQSLDRLTLIAQDKTPAVFNPNFFRYMARKREREEPSSPLVMKYVRHKTLIPNERNLRHLYRNYVYKQFYVADGTYRINPADNFYA